MTDYRLLMKQLEALTDGVPYTVTNLANAAALLYDVLDNINWAGFYLLRGDKLVLAPFQGKPACTVIPVGKGVCGTAVAEKRTILIDNVHAFPGHIACDGASNSELVIPLFGRDGVIGVLDIDSPVFSRFTDADREGLEAFAKVVETFFEA